MFIKKKIAIIAACILALVGLGLYGNSILDSQRTQLGSGYGPVKTSYDLIGTASSPATLSTSYSNTTTFRANNLDNLHLDIEFTPTSSNEYAEILVEVSNDDGSNWYPIGTISKGTTEQDLFAEDGSGNVGIPLVFPGDKTSNAGTAYRGAYDFNIVADLVRVRAKSSSSTGALHVRGTVSSP